MSGGEQLQFFAPKPRIGSFAEQVAAFAEFGQPSQQFEIRTGTGELVPIFINEFWTAKQRDAHSLHEVSYRACFKPQLPRFFIERLTKPRDIVYDPFMGRGTTLVEAALHARVPFGCDVNPLSKYLVSPRLNPHQIEDVQKRLNEINLERTEELREDLLVFYEAGTLKELHSLRTYFLERRESGKFDEVDGWICMVALNRLTGHSNGFFSVYTLPPNQAVTVVSQRKINAKRNQTPEYRDTRKLILKKSKQLLKDVRYSDLKALREISGRALLLTGRSDETSQIPPASVSLVVTSPPFLDIVDYKTDNWLRCWFMGIDAEKVGVTVPRKLDKWQQEMTAVFAELARVLKPGGHVAFEVGEVRKGTVKLEETVLACGLASGLKPLLIMINQQEFTKTANCWGVDNNSKGTNTNRIVVFQKPL